MMRGVASILVVWLLFPGAALAQTPAEPAPETSADAAPETPEDPAPKAAPVSTEETPADQEAPPPAAVPTPDLPDLVLPVVDADTLAMGEQLDLVAGTFNFASAGRASDGLDNEITTLGLTLGARYFRSLETPRFGYGTTVAGSESFARSPYDGGSRFDNTLALAITSEGRYYPMEPNLFFAYAAVDVDVAIYSETSTETNGPGLDDSTMPGNVGVALGVGVGRVLAIDPVVRLRRLEQALREEGVLTGPLSPETGTDVIRTWYALRNEFSHYPMLGHTLKLVASQMASTPNARATYKALAVLSDPFIVERRRGWEARIGAGLVVPFVGFVDDPNFDQPDPVPAVLGSAQYELPIGTDRQLSLRGKLLVDLRTPSDDGVDVVAAPWSARGYAKHTWVFYNDLYDPTGALSWSGEAGISGARWPDSVGPTPEIGLDLVTTGSYSRALNRGSLATGGLTLGVRNDGVYQLLVTVGLTWGVTSGFFTPYTNAQSF